MNNPTIDLEPAVCRLIEDMLHLNAGTVLPASRMETVPGWDSLQHLGIVLAIEEEFGCSIGADELPTVTSVRALVAAIGRQVIASRPS
jgi:acyl carrier protein